MSQTVLIFLMAFYMIYIITIQLPKRIKALEDKVDSLNRQLKEVNIKLINLNDRDKIR